MHLPLLVGVVGPDAGETIGLQLDAHLDAVGRRLAAGRLLRALRLGQNAEQILHVMADFVRDHVGFGELAGLAAAAVKAHLHVAEERRVEIDALVARAVERTHRRLREAAAALLAAAIEPQRRRSVFLAADAEDLAPDIFGIAEHGGDELAGLSAGAPVRRAGSRLGCWYCEPPPLRISAPPISTLGSMPSAQPIRLEHHHGTDAEPAAARPEYRSRHRRSRRPSRSSSTLSLRRKSSQRICKSFHSQVPIMAESNARSPMQLRAFSHRRAKNARWLRHFLPSGSAVPLTRFLPCDSMMQACRL